MAHLADPNCPRCRGRGHVLQLDPGLIVPVRGEVCPCVARTLARQRAGDRLAAAELPEVYAEATPDGFNIRPHKPILCIDRESRQRVTRDQRAIDLANQAAIAEMCGRRLRGEHVALFGPSGAGKTYLASALLRAQILEHGASGLYIRVLEYLRRIRPEGAEPDERRRLIRRTAEVDILLLDDLGIEKPSVFAMSELWDLIDARVGGGRSLLITTNAASLMEALHVPVKASESGLMSNDQREAIEIGKRIISRLRSVVKVEWPPEIDDWRAEQGKRANRTRLSNQEERRRLEAESAAAFDGLDVPGLGAATDEDVTSGGTAR